MKISWKAIAIISLVLLILETVSVVWLYNIGIQAINADTECAVNVCAYDDAYYYDSVEDICYCYVGKDVVSQKFMG